MTRSLLLLVLLPGLATAADDAALARARKLLRKHVLIDGHNDLAWVIRKAEQAPRDIDAYDIRGHAPGQTDLERLRQGGVGGQFWSVYVPAEPSGEGFAAMQLEEIEMARRLIEKYPDRLGFAASADDVQRQFKRGRIASLLGMEGGQGLEDSLGALRAYHALGVRYMTLTHSVTLDWADAAGDEPRHGGLTRFGEEVVREMNRLGMLVDLSHTTAETMDDALRVSEAPVIFSHSSARAVCDHVRNVPDEILGRLPANGGIVMVTFVPSFVSQEVWDATRPYWEEYKRRIQGVEDSAERERIYKELFDGLSIPKASVAQVADHVEHIRRVAGVDHVGIGSDFDGTERLPEGLEDVSKYPNLFAELIRRGWKDEDLEKLAGKNLLRVMRRAEAVSRRLQKLRPPSLATIESLDGPRSPISGQRP